MTAYDFFAEPQNIFQRQYEALRMYFFEKKAAKEVAKELGLRDRGIKPRNKGDRGWYFLRNADAELAIIAETAFVDNTNDIAKLFSNYEFVVNAYVDWIVRWVQDND